MQPEKVLVLITPEAVRKGLTSTIELMFRHHGMEIIHRRWLETVPHEQIKRYLAAHSPRTFHQAETHLTSGTLVALVVQAPDAIKRSSKLLSSRNPEIAGANTIRGKLGKKIRRNLLWVSNSRERARKEISIWFGD